ncbi:MAG: hypothetical protein IIV48_00785 [Clostridium sp.]|nr:hypothetical protein [Clostridium sp.]
MRNSKFISLIKINSAIVILNIVLFSPGLLNIEIGGTSILKTALGVTIITMSIIIFIIGNYSILMKEDNDINIYKVVTSDDCIEALNENKYKKIFSSDIDILLEQIDRIENKVDTIEDILIQKFSISEMSYKKFNYVILDIKNLFYVNIKSIINKINIFDQNEYKKINKRINNETNQNKILIEKINMYKEYITFVKNAIEDNEEILLRLDKVLLELSKFNSLDEGELENMSAMDNIDDLISKIKLYK